MEIGPLNKRVKLQYETQTADDMGGFTVVWTDAATVWAAIWPTSAKELTQSMQTDMVITHRIRIRYRSSFIPSYRIKFGDRYFNIISIINPSERNEYFDIMAKEST